MMLWFVMALMTAAAIFAVLWPLARRTPLRSGSDVAVYRDQLDEIERDRAAGLIAEREAEAARIEVSRRLIAAADMVPPPLPQDGMTRRRRIAALAALILLPLGAAALYLSLGSPQLTSQPLEARRELTPEQSSVMELVARVEAHLEQNPEDGRGWEVLGPVYMRLGRYDDAVRARRTVLRLLGPSAAREADLGEAITGAQNGIVTAEAKEAFDRAVALDPRDVRPDISLGLPPSRTDAQKRPPRYGGRCSRRHRRMRRGRASCVSRWRGSIPPPRHHRSRARARTMSPRQAKCPPSSGPRWCGAWCRGLRNGSSRTAAMSRGGCGSCALIWCWVTRNRLAPPRAKLAGRWRAIRKNFAASMN